MSRVELISRVTALAHGDSEENHIQYAHVVHQAMWELDFSFSDRLEQLPNEVSVQLLTLARQNPTQFLYLFQMIGHYFLHASFQNTWNPS